MKLFLPILLATTTTASAAFVPVSQHRPAYVLRSTASAETESAEGEAAAADEPFFASALPEKPDPYQELGWDEEDVAVGIKPEDILKYLGTREDIIEIFMSDNKSFDRARAEEEVDRFIIDPEMLDTYIEYNKRKIEDPESIRALQEGNDANDPAVWGTYAAWIAGGVGFAQLKNVYLDSAPGDGGILANLPHPDFLFHSPAADTAVGAVGDAVSSVVDPAGVQSVVEGVSGAVSDALTKCVGESCP